MGGDGALAVADRKGAKPCISRGKGLQSKQKEQCTDETHVETCLSVSDRLQDILGADALPLNASRAIDLVAQFMAVAPHANREDMERLKMLDKFLNTARALMETRLKTEDAQAISDRLDIIEEELNS